jgi:biotin carboxyl carrier protein
MYTIKSGLREYKIEFDAGKQESGKIDGSTFEIVENKINSKFRKVSFKGKLYNVIIEDYDSSEKTMSLRINGTKHVFEIKDNYDEMLQKLGLVGLGVKKAGELKSPMPGLVLKVNFKEGEKIKKGEGVIILEAMKMENILKSPADAVIKSVHVKVGDVVDKNQLLVRFE